MIKRIKEKNYEYRHPLATIIADEVEVGISATGRRSISETEIQRLGRLAALSFLRKNYSQFIKETATPPSPKVIRAIIAILNVNQSEFATLIGCQKSKVSKVLRGEQIMSKSQELLTIERLATELAYPGSARSMVGGGAESPVVADRVMIGELNAMRLYGCREGA